MTGSPKAVRLKDYAPPPFLIDRVALRFEIEKERTLVRSRLELRRNPKAQHTAHLVLDGNRLSLLSAVLDDVPLEQERYSLDERHLTIYDVVDQFTLVLETAIEPQNNTSLEGLYKSGGIYCTQCEAEGFRNITWFLDRPDVMARYSTTIVADAKSNPILLSNGNRIGGGLLEDGRHWVEWEDPFPKPSYLFALVAGQLACVEDTFATTSGRNVDLRIYVQEHNAQKCAHAMASLKRAMEWDQDVFGLEYDLDTYMIVAVDDFNMGAMENKGLNIFNSKYVLARPETATDSDFGAIESVIGHEYFHNWTGNRVTCRDWFQLSLKEGLTVFRDQQFSADMASASVKRIQDVRTLRAHQFAEDAGPMAHPVRPDSYIEISNFYTVTIYNKGAEIIRMIHTLLGAAAFRAGLDLYFSRHDGEAVTTEEFVKAMEDASGADLNQFRLWYVQAGTPEVSVDESYDASKKEYRLTLKQTCPPTPDQPVKRPFHIPLSIGLLNTKGEEVPLVPDANSDVADEGALLNLRRPRQTFKYKNVAERPVLSLGRGFTAPVNLRYERSDADTALLLANDSDPFNRWDAAQDYATKLLFRLIENHQQGVDTQVPSEFVDAMAQTLRLSQDMAFVAETLSLPTETYLADRMSTIDVDAIHHTRLKVRRSLATALEPQFRETYQRTASDQAYAFEPKSTARRALRNLCLSYLMELNEPETRRLAMQQIRGSDNMTDVLAALTTLVNTDCAEREEAIRWFYERWANDNLVLDKWFTLQATSRLPETLSNVRALLGHRAFDLRNPNKVRALIGAFSHGNPVRFHDGAGRGYRFLADRVIELDSLNPQIAARLLGAFSRWRKFESARRKLMKAQLERIMACPELSKDTYEIAMKTLA